MEAAKKFIPNWSVVWAVIVAVIIIALVMKYATEQEVVLSDGTTGKLRRKWVGFKKIGAVQQAATPAEPAE